MNFKFNERETYNASLDENMTEKNINRLTANRIQNTGALPSELSNLQDLLTSEDKIKQVKIIPTETKGRSTGNTK